MDPADAGMDNPPEPEVEALDRRLILAWKTIGELEAKLAEYREVLERVRSNVQTVRETSMDPVLGPTYIIHGITLNRIDAALSAHKEGGE